MILNTVLIGMAAGGAFLLGFLLFFNPQKNNVVANRWLGIFAFTLALAILEIFLNNLGFQSPVFLELIGLSRFLSAPTLYLTILYFTSPSRIFRSKDLFHFMPFVLFALFRVPFMITGQNPQFSEQFSMIIFPILINALPVQSLLYWLLSFRKLQQHLQNLRLITSSTESIDLLWLRNFLLVLMCIVILWFNLLFFNVSFLYDFTPFLYLVCIYFLAYFSLQQKEIYPFNKKELTELSEIISEVQNSKTEKYKRLSDSQLDFFKHRLEDLMAIQKIYLDNELSLPVLAQKLGINSHETSYLINEAFGENFFSYVNKYRVEEAKRLLLSDKYDRFNILGIAFESGFNSKTTFNTTFKKISGQSPSEFVKSVNK